MSEDYMGVPGLTQEEYERSQFLGRNWTNEVLYPDTPKIIVGNKKVYPEPEKYLSVSGSDSSTPSVTISTAVKKAEPQYVDFNEANVVPITDTELTDLYFEQINGGGLLVLNNRNFVNTGTFIYQPIVNISDFVREYNPRKLIAIQETSDTFFSNFPINLDEKIPKTPTSGILNGTNVYIDSANNIVIETKDMRVDERVEIQVLLDGTIYEDVLDLGMS